MNISCPSCSAKGTVDGSKLPLEGRSVICPKCSTRFHILPESLESQSPTTSAHPEERMTCPKCGCEQQKGDSCVICGNIIKKTMRDQIRHVDPVRIALPAINIGPIVTNVWYQGMFNRRQTLLLVRVLSLLLLIAMFMTCTSSNSRRKARNNVTDVSVSGQTPAERDAASDEQFKSRFDAVVNGLNANIDQCFRQCYSYISSPWYLQGDDKPNWTHHRHILTDSMLVEYTDIVTKKRGAANIYRIPTPSPRYYDCYYKINHLNNLYDSLYKYVENYETYHYGFNSALSNLRAEHLKLQEDLIACRRSF